MTVDDRMEPLIRPATSADLPRLGRLGALLVETHHDFDPQRFLPTRDRTPADYAGFMLGQLGDPDVAVVEGYDWMALRGPAGVLHDIVVDPEYRGRGVGRQLLHAALAFLQERGAPRVVLSTAERNAVAQRLFASAGFRRTMIEMTRETTGETTPAADGGTP